MGVFQDLRYRAEGIKFDIYYRKYRGMYRDKAGIDVPANESLPFDNIAENLKKYETSKTLREYRKELKQRIARDKTEGIADRISEELSQDGENPEDPAEYVQTEADEEDI